MTLEERFWAKVDRSSPDGCWLWTAGTFQGYGQFSVQNRTRRAHRIAWVLAGRELPEPPLVLDHLCRNRGCVNPDHLEVVTNRENLLRGEGIVAREAQKTHCPQGHPYDDANTYVTKGGWRDCRTCHNERSRNLRRRRRAARAATPTEEPEHG